MSRLLRVVGGKHAAKGVAALASILASFEAGYMDAGDIRFYTGTKPVNPSTNPSGATFLGSLTFVSPNSAPVANEISPTSIAMVVSGGFVVAAGTVTWCRIRTSDNRGVFDQTVGTSGTDFLASAVAWTVGQTITPVQIVATGTSTPAFSGSLTVA